MTTAAVLAISSALLHEGMGRRRMAGAAVVAGGIALLLAPVSA